MGKKIIAMDLKREKRHANKEDKQGIFKQKHRHMK